VKDRLGIFNFWCESLAQNRVMPSPYAYQRFPDNNDVCYCIADVVLGKPSNGCGRKSAHPFEPRRRGKRITSMKEIAHVRLNDVPACRIGWLFRTVDGWA
jgi:hypothetical protein